MINTILEILPIVSCQEATRLASLKMERKLSIKETFDLKLHFAFCRLCRSFSQQINGLRVVLRCYSPQQEKTLPQKSKDHLKKILRNQNS